jgi:general secretion pathway protein D
MELTDAKNAVNVENLFPQVDFPKGSSAIYQPKMKILFVRNTAENFAVLEPILDAMEVLKDSDGGDQVEIETKFVEVSEGTLEELGFEWRTVAGNNVDLGNNVNIPAGQYLFDDALRGGPSGPAMPFSTSGGPDGSPGATGDWSTFRMTDTFSTNPDSMKIQHRGSTPIDLLISALDQSSGADVLSAPRIVTKSGEEATIRVGERHYYPEVYEADTDQAAMLTIAYQDFTEKLLGIELVVTPEVDGDQITLALNPRIIELTGWQNYQLAPANSIYNHRQNAISKNYTHNKAVVARLPIFKKREIQTEVRISDGSTIGMGGLISEKIESFEDKVPVLGSLPLIGRLFCNEGERRVKRNLLMFVTAKIVEPTGRVNTSRSFE